MALSDFGFVFCLLGVRWLLGTEPRALHMLGKRSTTNPYMQRSDGILGPVTKCASSNKGQINSVCSLLQCREKKKKQYPLSIIPDQTKLP